MDTIRLETADLLLDEVGDDDLDAIVAIRRSNPVRLARTEGTETGPGHYDRGMLERDLAVTAFDPERHVLCVRLREDGRLVGYVDILDAHPYDGVPWLGVVEISAPVQRQGYGRQCVEAVMRRVEEELGRSTLRAAADRDDGASVSFLQHVGFAAVSPAGRSSPQGQVAVTIFERRLYRASR